MLRVLSNSSPPLTRFVLLSTQRSGTSWLMERLAAHPEVGAYGELLLGGREGWPEWPPGASDRPFYQTYLTERDAGARRREHRHLFSYLDYLYEPRRGFRAIGFKLMYNEATPYPELLVYLKARGVRVLHLARSNLLDIAFSQIAMRSRTFVHAWSPDQREAVRVTVDTAYLLKLLRRHERDRVIARRVLRAARVPVHEASYEALVADDAHLTRILRFLRIPDGSGGDLQATMLKLAPSSHRDTIENFQEVETALRGTRFHRFLRDA